jgi:hypothetical protein
MPILKFSEIHTAPFNLKKFKKKCIPDSLNFKAPSPFF